MHYLQSVKVKSYKKKDKHKITWLGKTGTTD